MQKNRYTWKKYRKTDEVLHPKTYKKNERELKGKETNRDKGRERKTTRDRQ